MQLQIRIVDDSEIQDAYYLSAQAFRGGQRDDKFAERRLNDKNRSASTMFGVYDAAGLQAKVVVIPYDQVFGSQFVASMGGIGGVACLPASRGKGYAAACLKHALIYMRESGMYLSALYPFSWEFYRRLGWEWIGAQRTYTVPTRTMIGAKETEGVRLATKTDHQAIGSVYSDYTLRYRGMAKRNERGWNSILDDGQDNYTYTYIYESTDRVEGYLTFQGGSKERTHLNEFIALTPRAQRGLLGLLRRHEMQISGFRWSVPDDDALWSNLYHNDIETRIEPVVQARIVDFVQAFKALKPSSEINGEVVISVSDETAPWNTGKWLVCAESGSISIADTHADPDIECDIQAITQAYYGYPALDAIRRAARLSVYNENGYNLLNRLLAGPTVWLNDHF
jgi:predicted acetyltransferase